MPCLPFIYTQLPQPPYISRGGSIPRSPEFDPTPLDFKLKCSVNVVDMTTRSKVCLVTAAGTTGCSIIGQKSRRFQFILSARHGTSKREESAVKFEGRVEIHEMGSNRSNCWLRLMETTVTVWLSTVSSTEEKHVVATLQRAHVTQFVSRASTFFFWKRHRTECF